VISPHKHFPVTGAIFADVLVDLGLGIVRDQSVMLSVQQNNLVNISRAFQGWLRQGNDVYIPAVDRRILKSQIISTLVQITL
jgi:hypothetical protein